MAVVGVVVAVVGDDYDGVEGAETNWRWRPVVAVVVDGAVVGCKRWKAKRPGRLRWRKKDVASSPWDGEEDDNDEDDSKDDDDGGEDEGDDEARKSFGPPETVPRSWARNIVPARRRRDKKQSPALTANSSL